MRRALKWFLCLLLGFVLLVVAAYFLRAPLLTALGNAWMVNDPLVKADAIVVLGGGTDTRPVAAATLYRAGWAPRILVLQPKPPTAAERGLTLSDGETTRRLLELEGVPGKAVELLLPFVSNTFEESQEIATWAKTNRAKCLLVPTDIFHTRRAAWILQRCARGNGTEIRMIGVNTRRYTTTNWWQNEQGLVDFQNEVFKYAYYWFKY